MGKPISGGGSADESKSRSGKVEGPKEAGRCIHIRGDNMYTEASVSLHNLDSSVLPQQLRS
jgi:hypothetical protein